MKKKSSVDTPFLLVLCAIVAFGLLIFTSAALGLLARGSGASFSSVAVSQLLLGLVCGGIACFTLARIDYRLWRKYTPYLFAFSIVLTLLVFVPHIGLELKGAARWVKVGPISFQPEEILKFATIAFLAAVYAVRIKTVPTLRGLLPLAYITGPAAVLLLLQPNTAGVMMLGAASVGVLFSGGKNFAASGNVTAIFVANFLAQILTRLGSTSGA